MTIFCLLAGFLFLSSGCMAARTRLRNTLDVKYNLGCQLPQCNKTEPNQTAVNVFQIISTNPELTSKTNFIWSTVGGPPMVITTSSTQQSTLLIDWPSILNVRSETTNTSTVTGDASQTSTQLPPPRPTPSTSGFHFDVTQDGAIGLLVEKIIIFDDVNKDGAFTPGKPRVEIDWGQIAWDQASRTTFHKDDFLKTFFRMKSSQKYLNGNLLIKLAIPRDFKADRQNEVPHLKLNDRSISIVVIVDGMQAPPGFKNPRLAMTLVVVVQTPTEEVSLYTDSESMISDEYTPGVFRIKSLEFKSKPSSPRVPTNETNNSPGVYAAIDGQPATTTSAPQVVHPWLLTQENKDKLGFLYWKEVAYTDRRKIISRTIDVYDSQLEMSLDTLPNISQPFYQYFMYQPPSGPKPKYQLYRFDLIFGKGDTSFSSTNLTDFSFVFGLGAAPQEQMFSFLVSLTVFVCFCLPVLVMFAGLTYLMVRKYRRNEDTDLLITAESQ